MHDDAWRKHDDIFMSFMRMHVIVFQFKAEGAIAQKYAGLSMRREGEGHMCLTGRIQA